MCVWVHVRASTAMCNLKHVMIERLWMSVVATVVLTMLVHHTEVLFVCVQAESAERSYE